MSKNILKMLAMALMSLCLFASQSAFAQSKVKISGTVLDPNAEPLIGVNVMEQGTTNGTMTNIDGQWELEVTPGATIVVSCIGYYTQEIVTSAGRTSYPVTLAEDTTVLEEVVVVGFGSQKKVNLTGSVAVATSDELEARPVNDVPSALQGLLPGLQLTHAAGDINTTMNIRVRGTGTIGSGSSDAPLVLIDGMVGDINTLNPQDVESISVLKDAASASIYGARAAFGVVLVTTKKGADGKGTVSYNNNFRFSSPTIVPKPMDSYTFGVYFNDAHRNAGQNPIFTDETLQMMLDFQAKGGTSKGGLLPSIDGKYWGKPGNDPYTTGFANTDWYAELYKDYSFSQEHNVSLSGGTRNITYYASLGALDSDGLIRYGNDHTRRINLSANFSAALASWATFRYSIRYVRQTKHTPATYITNIYGDLGRQTWPNLPIYDENGYFTSNGSGGNMAQRLAESGFNNTLADQYTHQASLVLEPIKNWVTHIEFNFRNNISNTYRMSLPLQDHDVEGNLVPTTSSSSLQNSENRSDHYNWNIYSDYTLKVANDHNFKFMLGFQTDEEIIKAFSVTRNGVQDPNLPVLSLTTGLSGTGATTNPSISGTENQWSTAGFFGRINYDYKGKYLLEGNLRYDGTSRFRQASRWTWSPSISAGWNIAQEDFWEPIKGTVNMLKLRASFGTLSNQNTSGYYPTYRTMTLGTANGAWLQNGTQPNTARVGGLISASLTWEKVETYNLGLDWGAFNNRFTGTIEGFQRFTHDMVGPALDLPATLGLSAPSANNCDLKTVGWEVNFSWRDRTPSGFGYSISANISDARTIILKYPDNTTHAISSYNEGHEMGEIWGFETVGMAKTQAEMDAHLAKVDQSAIGSMWGAGDIMYADLNGDGKLTRGAQTLEDHGDLKVIGINNQHYFFGVNLQADYKGFDVRALLQGVLQNDIFISNQSFWGVVSWIWNSCAFREHGDYFRAEPTGLPGHEIPANTDAYYPRPLSNSGKNQQTQTKYLQDASYIRLKNLQLGYTIPQHITSKIGLSRARAFASIDNLWTGTKLNKLFDPETVRGGQGGNAYPLSRTLSFGVSLTF